MLQETHLQAKDFLRMCKPWVGEVAASAALGRRAGELIMVKRNSGFQITSIEINLVGRRISIVLEVSHSSFRLTSNYTPNSPTRTYFQELTTWLYNYIQYTHHIF